MKRLSPDLSTFFAASALALTLAHPAFSQEKSDGLEYTVRAGAGYTDNLSREDQGQVESAFYSLGTRVSYGRDTGRVEADVVADLDWMDYEEQGFESQVWGNLDASVRYDFVPEIFGWNFEDNFGQGTRNPLQSSSPGNVESINFFSTGPYATFRFGDAGGVTVDAHYSNVWYEESLNDNDRYGGNVSLFREPSANSRLYLQAAYETVQFDTDALAPDYDRADATLGYVNEGARTTLKADAGWSRLEYDQDTQDGPLLRLSLTRVLTVALTLDVNGGYEYQDAAGDLRREGSIETGSSGVIANGQVYEDIYGGVRLRFDKNRTGIAVGTEYHDQDYLDSDLVDRERTKLIARIERKFGRSLKGYLRGALESVDFQTDAQADYDETDYGLGLAWSVQPTLDLDLTYQYRTRPSDSVDTFEENEVWLKAEWAPTRR